MPLKARENLFGAWAFLIGTVLAFVVGIFFRGQISPVMLGILAVIGILIGVFVNERAVQTFLLAAVSLVIVSYAGVSGLVLTAAVAGIDIGRLISSILGALLVLFVPATIIVALKTMFSVAAN